MVSGTGTRAADLLGSVSVCGLCLPSTNGIRRVWRPGEHHYYSATVGMTGLQENVWVGVRVTSVRMPGSGIFYQDTAVFLTLPVLNVMAEKFGCCLRYR